MRYRLAALCISLFAANCLPTEIELDPKNVVDVQVRPASGQALFCPGDKFQIEVVVKLADGSTCSNVDAERGCLGKKDAVIAWDQVKIEASPGSWPHPETYLFVPSADALETAAKGVLLRAHIQAANGAKSVSGERVVAPVYDCQKEGTYAAAAQSGTSGENGADGPEVRVAITSLSTPWFPNAALVRVESGSAKAYFISPSADRPIRIVSRGQDGARGSAGAAGTPGAEGAAVGKDAPACTPGSDGGPGTNGGSGGNGGNGGAGGKILVMVDDAKGDALRSRVTFESVGGAAGAAGPGGAGGAGGKGGAGAPGGPACGGVPVNGKDGVAGKDGAAGNAGAAGAAGPAPVFSSAPRATLFGTEMAAITAIEATPRAANSP